MSRESSRHHRLRISTATAVAVWLLAAAWPAPAAASDLADRVQETLVQLALANTDESVSALESLLESARAEGDARTEGMVLWGLAAARLMDGESEKGGDLAMASLNIWKTLDDPVWTQYVSLQRSIASSGFSETEHAYEKARLAFLQPLLEREVELGRLTTALRLNDEALSMLAGELSDPELGKVRGALLLQGEGIRRSLSLPSSPETRSSALQLMGDASGIPEIFVDALELDELTEHGAARDDDLQRATVHLGESERYASWIEVIEAADRRFPSFYGKLSTLCEDTDLGTRVRAGAFDRDDPRPHLCAFLDALAPIVTYRRIDPITARRAVVFLMDWYRTGSNSARAVAGRSLLALESALGEPTSSEDWPSTEDLTALLEAGEQSYADVPPELRSGLDSSLSAFAQFAVRSRIRAGDPAGAFELAERARTRAFLDRLTTSRLAHADPERLAEIASLRRHRDELERRLVELSNSDPTGPLSVRLAEELALVVTKIDSAFHRLALNAPPAERARLASLDDLRRKLDEETVVVAFMDFPDQPERPLAWVVDQRSGGGLRTYVFPAEYLESRIALWARQIRNGDDESGLAAELHQALWAPLAEHIDARRIVIIPHGVFQDVPFAALRNPDTGRRLIEDHALLYAPSASAWVHMASSRHTTAKERLILGDPGGDLPGAAEEARTIGAIWSSAPLLAEAATEEALRARAPRAGLIHVASHGTRSTDPAFTRLQLAPGPAGSPDPRLDGRLELHEIADQLDLRRTALAVLPACHTGSGPRTRGDEVASVARAFLLAGARSVVTTGWAVDDLAAAALMVDLHRHLAAGVEAAEALRRAQIAALRSPDRSDPRHWAAFALHGAGGRVAPAAARPVVLADRTVEALEIFGREGWAETGALEEAARSARAADTPGDEAALLWGLSHAAIEEGRFADALELARRARETWEALGDEEWTRRLTGWEALASDLLAGEPAAPPVLRALFLAELIEVEMDRFRITSALRQAERALSLIDGLGREALVFRLRLYRAAARAMLEPSEATLTELSRLMAAAARVLEDQRPTGRPDVTPLIQALPDLMLAMSSGDFSSGKEVLEELVAEHADLLPPDLLETIGMLGHLESQDMAAATEWCRRMKAPRASADAPPSADLGFLCDLIDFLPSEDQVTVDLTSLQVLFESIGRYAATLDGPLRDPVQSLSGFADALTRAIASGGEIPSTDDLVAALGIVEELGGSVPLTRRSGPDQSILAPFGNIAAVMSAEAGWIEDSFELADRARARELLDLLGTRHVATTGDEVSSREIMASRSRAHELEDRLLDLAVSDPTAPETATLREELATVRVEIDHRFEQIALRHPAGLRAATVPLAEIRAALGEDTTLVMYHAFSWPGNEELAEDPFAWIVDRDGIERVELDVDAGVLADEIRLFVGKLRDGTSTEDVAERLYSHIWLPLREHLDTRRIVLVPHGALLDLPFAALRDPDSGEELIRQKTLLYAPSASAWVRLRDRATGDGTAVVMGNPAGDLDAAEAEARAIGGLWNTLPLTRAEATERRFRELAPRASVVHVASHGVLAPIDPAFSYLELAPPSGASPHPHDDGRLELHEMTRDVDLAGTGLVVLSACRAGTGPITGGGEMASLARGLLLAGARSAVTAAWDVDDRAAEVLMVELHSRLAAGVEAAEALRGAQEAVLDGTGYRHPGFWAGFALHGAGGTVPGAERR